MEVDPASNAESDAGEQQQPEPQVPEIRMRRRKQPHTKRFRGPTRPKKRPAHSAAQAEEEEVMKKPKLSPTCSPQLQGARLELIRAAKKRGSDWLQANVDSLHTTPTNLPHIKTRKVVNYRKFGFPQEGPPIPTDEDLKARGQAAIICFGANIDINPFDMVDCRVVYKPDAYPFDFLLPKDYRPLVDEYPPCFVWGKLFVCMLCIDYKGRYLLFTSYTSWCRHHVHIHVPVGKFVVCPLYGCSYKVPIHQYRDLRLKHACSAHPDHYGLMYDGCRFLSYSSAAKMKIFLDYEIRPWQWIVVNCQNDHFDFGSLWFMEKWDIPWFLPCPSTNEYELSLPLQLASDASNRNAMAQLHRQINGIPDDLDILNPEKNDMLVPWCYKKWLVPKDAKSLADFGIPLHEITWPEDHPIDVADVSPELGPHEEAGPHKRCHHCVIGPRQDQHLERITIRVPVGNAGRYRYLSSMMTFPSLELAANRDGLRQALLQAGIAFTMPNRPADEQQELDPTEDPTLIRMPLIPAAREFSTAHRDDSAALGPPEVDPQAFNSLLLQDQEYEVQHFLDSNILLGKTEIKDPIPQLEDAVKSLRQPCPAGSDPDSINLLRTQYADLRARCIQGWGQYRLLFTQAMTMKLASHPNLVKDLDNKAKKISTLESNLDEANTLVHELRDGQQVLLDSQKTDRQTIQDHKATISQLQDVWLKMPATADSEVQLRGDLLAANQKIQELERVVKHLQSKDPTQQ